MEMGGTLISHSLSFHTDPAGHSCDSGIVIETSARDGFRQQDAVNCKLLHHLNHKYPILSFLPSSYCYLKVPPAQDCPRKRRRRLRLEHRSRKTNCQPRESCWQFVLRQANPGQLSTFI